MFKTYWSPRLKIRPRCSGFAVSSHASHLHHVRRVPSLTALQLLIRQVWWCSCPGCWATPGPQDRPGWSSGRGSRTGLIRSNTINYKQDDCVFRKRKKTLFVHAIFTVKKNLGKFKQELRKMNQIIPVLFLNIQHWGLWWTHFRGAPGSYPWVCIKRSGRSLWHLSRYDLGLWLVNIMTTGP